MIQPTLENPEKGLVTENKNLLPESPEFKQLVASRRRMSIIFTSLILIIYFGFILFIAFSKESLSYKWLSNLPLGLPVGLGIICSAWLLTGIYVYWANNSYDPMVQDLKNKIKKQ